MAAQSSKFTGGFGFGGKDSDCFGVVLCRQILIQIPFHDASSVPDSLGAIMFAECRGLVFFEPVTSSLVKPPGIHWNCGIFEARELPSGFVLTQIYPQMGVRSFVLEDAFLRI